MIYEEYYKKYLRYKKVKKEINDLEDKKISLMSMVDIQSVPPKDNDGGTNIKDDKMLIYVSELESTLSDLEKKNNILVELKRQLDEKLQELKESSEDLDKVYLFKYIYHLKYYQIAVKISCGKTKTYDLINEIDKKLSEIKITEKNGKI